MKKLLLVLMVVAIAAFLLVGCNPVTPPPDDGDDGGGDVTEVEVAVEGAVLVDGLTYVKEGTHDVTVTFPAPVAGVVTASISPCSGNYTKAFTTGGSPVVLFPDATRKIWTGSGNFKAVAADGEECCASYVEVSSGECEEVVCIMLPVIVDGEPPKATIEVCLTDCTCAGCSLVFSSHINEEECEPDEVVCGDDCSGLASWAIDIYNEYPFKECCLIPCVEPIESDSGVCPIDFTTTCLTDLLIARDTDTFYVLVTLVDNVGNETRFGADITFNPDSCDLLIVTPWAWQEDGCTDTPDFAVCAETSVLHTTTLNPDVAQTIY